MGVITQERSVGCVGGMRDMLCHAAHPGTTVVSCARAAGLSEDEGWDIFDLHVLGLFMD